MKNRFIKSNEDGSPLSSDEDYEYHIPREKKNKNLANPSSSSVKFSETQHDPHNAHKKRAQFQRKTNAETHLMSQETTDTAKLSSVEFQQIFLKRLGVWIDQTGGLPTPKQDQNQEKKPSKHFNFQDAKLKLFPVKTQPIAVEQVTLPINDQELPKSKEANIGDTKVMNADLKRGLPPRLKGSSKLQIESNKSTTNALNSAISPVTRSLLTGKDSQSQKFVSATDTNGGTKSNNYNATQVKFDENSLGTTTGSRNLSKDSSDTKKKPSSTNLDQNPQIQNLGQNFYFQQKQQSKRDPIKEMEDILKVMKMRDCQGNIMKMQEEMRNLQATKHINHFARLSHHKLASIRKQIPKEFLMEGVPNDFDRINLELLNEYLNKYAEKISRANAINPSNIKIDFGQFDQVICGIDNQTANPFSQHIDWKLQLKQEINNSSHRQTKPRAKYMDHFIDEKEEARKKNPIRTEIAEKVERQEIKQELKDIVERLDPAPAKMKNLFLKDTDINKFENYKNVILNLRHKQTQIINDKQSGRITPISTNGFNSTNNFGSDSKGRSRLLSQGGGGTFGSPQNFMHARNNQRVSTAGPTAEQSGGGNRFGKFQNSRTNNHFGSTQSFKSMSSYDYDIPSDPKIEAIGEIWNSSNKMRNDTKKFKRKQERQLSKLNSQISKLNSLVNQSLSVVKKERERYRLIEQDKLIQQFKKQQEEKLRKEEETKLKMLNAFF